MLCNREQYRQGKHTLDEYIDLFQALVKQATYPDSLQLCLTFQDGLHPALVERINNLAEGHANNEKIASWYEVAWDQWQLMEIQRELHHPHSMLYPTAVSNFHLSMSTHPVPALTPATPVAHSLPLEILMDVNTACQLCTAPLLCQRCKKPEHFAWHCPLGLKVHYLSIAEQEELLLQLLAAKDATGAPPLDKPKPELTPEEDNTCSSPLEFKGDF
ncbi:hypothetical protein C0989_001823 [Termitomyces sp. Mn162]|nr:hypothetical protein C0989_004612 [Termitomyces sp. Mn162]KAG5349800.1 hypothetical protein C0989_001823 [Termitomyces sp. Mn162]